MKNVFSFGDGKADGGAHLVDLLGGKGANLAEMTSLGIPVPPGFTVTTAVCREYLRTGIIPDDVGAAIEEAMRQLETRARRQFGSSGEPLLVSVRSGAPVSMPGMMDTILNLGLNDSTTEALAHTSSNPRFAWDSYRRLIQMYGNVVLEIQRENGEDPFERLIDRARTAAGVEKAIDLPEDDLKRLVSRFKDRISEHSGLPFPEDPWEQLWSAIEAVFRSWNSRRAREYRRVHDIPDDLGTAVNVVAMVYGNMGDDSGTGVVFTRNPSTGEKGLFGEYLVNAQGEDVVSGKRDPVTVSRMAELVPQAYQELVHTCAVLERHFADVQDMEFTVERGRLYLLQTRAANRTAQAAIRIAVDLVGEDLITRTEALKHVQPEQVARVLYPAVDASEAGEPLLRGLPASPGAGVGVAVFDPERAIELAAEGKPVVLIRRETSPDDFPGMVRSNAIVTARGGMTSHAAVVARGMGKPCVAGCADLTFDGEDSAAAGTTAIREGDWITVDGTEGCVYPGRLPLLEPEPGSAFQEIMGWADEFRMLRVRANADTPEDAARARSFGAEGIGLCRTEHMFFGTERINTVREMILAEDEPGRRDALTRLLPMQREDFIGIFRAMAGFPVTIRLLDPPLHEFLPRTDEELNEVARISGLDAGMLRRRADQLVEANPMLGLRGCRLGIAYPEITEMQARAIFEAACAVQEEGKSVHPEIMIPLVSDATELKLQVSVVKRVAEEVFTERGDRVSYLSGTMIEIPRAALTAGEVAAHAEFFSFGTNDLTQTTFGISRDDSGSFLPMYVEEGILAADPFQTIDETGVGELMRYAVERGRDRRKALKIGICGEHGGDPASIDFCHRLGLNYVSCSPYRVPVARYAAAVAAIRHCD